jgi:hypothetical protein
MLCPRLQDTIRESSICAECDRCQVFSPPTVHVPNENLGRHQFSGLACASKFTYGANTAAMAHCNKRASANTTYGKGASYGLGLCFSAATYSEAKARPLAQGRVNLKQKVSAIVPDDFSLIISRKRGTTLVMRPMDRTRSGTGPASFRRRRSFLPNLEPTTLDNNYC